MRQQGTQLKLLFPCESTIRLPEKTVQEVQRWIAQLIREVWEYEYQENRSDDQREDRNGPS
jgi:hypothetical protein